MTLKGRRFSPTKGIHLPRKDDTEAGLGTEKCWMKTKLEGMIKKAQPSPLS